MTEQQPQATFALTEVSAFAPPHAPLAMPKQVLTPETGLLRRLLGAMIAMPLWRRASHRRAG